MGNIVERLKASLRMDVINGDSFEKSVFIKQVYEAIETITMLRAALTEKDKEIERLRSLVADLTVGCMDNVEVKDDSDG